MHVISQPLSSDELGFQTRGQLGIITLNRPNQLNACTEAMCIAMHAQLAAWEKTEAIKAVVIHGAGDKAFCAGGDIRAIYQSRNESHIAHRFFKHEYRLNQAIYHFSKPYIPLMNGITMGGGAGVSIHGKHRIATEKLKFAMPETGIGFFTDVGGSYFLSRCPSHVGMYLGLTGHTINAADAHQIGLVDYVVNSADLSVLLDALVNATWGNDPHQTVNQIAVSFATPDVASDLVSHRSLIERCFSQASVEEIMGALDQSDDEWAKNTAQHLRTRSPTSLKVVFEQLKRGAELDFDACMQMEYQMAKHFLEGSDFYEGIRAAVIDKDRSPRWHPATLEEVSEEMVAGYFLAVGEKL